MSGRFHAFFVANRRVLCFFVAFILLFLALQQLYLFTRARTGNVLSHRLNANAAAAILRRLGPEHEVAADGVTLVSRRVRLNVKKGCEGVEVALVLAAAVLAFPRPWKDKLIGLAVGGLLLYGANLVRIITLYYALEYAPEHFRFLHVSLWQTLMVLLVVSYFILWAARSNAPGAPRAS